ncbi:MAG: hypothetical protein K8R79_10345 [Calditrichales bacterium]|nr:hypothetical protein [Calditrichales bacterium]
MKYRVMRVANKNYQILQKIKNQYFPTINWAALGNEFMYRQFLDQFPEVIEQVDREQEQQNASC